MTKINDLLMANKCALNISEQKLSELSLAGNQSEGFIAFSEITKTVPCAEFPILNYVHLFWTSCGEIPGISCDVVPFKECCSFFPGDIYFLARVPNRKVICIAGNLSVIIGVGMDIIYMEQKIPLIIYVILFFARSVIAALSQLVFIISSEAYPTTLRSIGLGSSAAFGWVGAAMVPVATQALVIAYPKPVIFTKGTIILLAGIAVICLPKDKKDVKLEDFTGDEINSNTKNTSEEKKP
ncbi:synaptic vesicle 2-related protein [Trichonephila inaurata madagascariensis]|uniref:Synaptic vesicle 2-related protein n=1 Tax=Trichonephila inaurata madagascariensis TaxID=2747483 RepID=A0A8X7C3Q8_9ARAC|nr:synaptic vesicle 2-related protein [Trichonephila inaurata madagascariensis]